jgi:phage terminase small subunit
MMNSQKQRFINAYLVNSNATQSAIDAGYSEKTASAQGSRLLKNEAVNKALQQAQDDAGERNKIKIDHVLNGLLSEAQDKSEGSSPSARVSAWVHLGKHLGMFTNKVENTHKLEIQTLSNLMDELTAGG